MKKSEDSSVGFFHSARRAQLAGANAGISGRAPGLLRHSLTACTPQPPRLYNPNETARGQNLPLRVEPLYCPSPSGAWGMHSGHVLRT